MTNSVPIQSPCSAEEVTAYLDGELDNARSAAFERHAAECSFCADQLREQKQLLRTLHLAFIDGPPVLLPNNFGEIVTIHAHSDMRRLREAPENHQALLWSCLLSAASLVLMGSSALMEHVLGPIELVARDVIGILTFTWRTLSDAGTGLAVILHAFGVRFLFDSPSLGRVAVLLLAVASLLLAHLIRGYHRDRTASEEARQRANPA